MSFQKGNKIRVGIKHTEITKAKMKEWHKKNPSRYWLGKKFSDTTKKKMSRSQEKIVRPKFTKTWKENISKSHLGKPCPWNTGERSSNWKGGITPINTTIRTSPEMKLWRKSVFTRDNFTCQKYNIKGGTLCAHHINNFSDFPELRFAIDNGITLSEKAHKEFHKIYGRNNNTKEQLEEYLYGTRQDNNNIFP